MKTKMVEFNNKKEMEKAERLLINKFSGEDYDLTMTGRNEGYIVFYK